MQAIILAAGMGKRLKELTQNNTKCMIKVNNETLIERMLGKLDKYNLSKIIIVIGYQGDVLKNYISTLNIKTCIEYVNNPIYDKTNNIYSLFLAKDYLIKEDTLLFESDIIFDDEIIDILINDPYDTLALVDKYESWMDGTCVTLSKDNEIKSFISKKDFNFNEINSYYKTVNIYKFSKDFSNSYYVPFLEAYQKALGQNEYYEQVLKVITLLDNPRIKAKCLSGQKWYEIDDVQDLNIAESIFSEDDKKLEIIQKRYGGYWRYPKMLDFCYLVNPYFPPEHMKNEIKANFDNLLINYPSGIKINNLIAAKNFGIHPENILVGNGAAELINILINNLDGKTGFIKPTFEEYPNRFNKKDAIFFTPKNENFSYNDTDIINYFSDKKIKNLVIINPDNPSGNYINKKGIKNLINWTKANNIKLIVDESFIDFADEKKCSIINQNTLAHNKHMYVIKSISKSYGVPGIRLGIIASGNKDLLFKLKKEISIWNINSFGEFFMQILEKYKKEYTESLIKLRTERKRFENELSKIDGIKVIPSQSNFIMIKLNSDISSLELSKILLNKYNILVKDLSKKLKGKNYLRFAIRNTTENNILLSKLKIELNKKDV